MVPLLITVFIVLAFANSAITLLIRGEVNMKVPRAERVPFLMWGFAYWRMLARHRDLYPSSSLRWSAYCCLGGMAIVMFGVAWLGFPQPPR